MKGPRWTSVRTALILVGLILAVGFSLLARNLYQAAREANSARAALAAGNFRAARGPLLRWLHLRPRSAEAHLLLAQLELAEGDLGRVTEELNQARALGSSESGLRRVHAMVLSRIGRYGEAEPILERIANSKEGADPAVYEALARVYLKTYRLRQAEATIERWIKLAPADARPFLWLTEIDRRLQVDTSEALETHYREALRRDPELLPARLGLAELLRKAHRDAEATVEYSAYLAAKPDDPIALAGAGQNALVLDQFETAERLLNRSLELDPGNTTALKGRANVDVRRGDPAAAVKRLDQVVRLDPFDSEARYSRSLVLAALGQTEAAHADREAVDRLKRDHAELLKLRDRLLTAPNNNDLRSKVAAWMFAHGRDEEGLGWARAVLAGEPGHAVANLLLADYYSKLPNEVGLANFYRLQAARGDRAVP